MISVLSSVLCIINFTFIWKTLKSDSKKLKKGFTNSEFIYGKKVEENMKSEK